MQIEFTLKMQGGSEVKMADGTIYTFIPNANDEHVAEVKNAAHIERFLAVPGYRIARDEKASVKADASAKAQKAEADRLAAEAAAEAEAKRIADEKAAQEEADRLAAEQGQGEGNGEPAGDDADTDADNAADEAIEATQLAAMTPDALAALYETEMGRKPHHRAGPETLINQIIENRKAKGDNAPADTED
ncbi:hypothetical protein [Pararhodobacter sp.]|uniref:hypothetical protein n=1 Tax=Pararhodobacter sp. TaxID=2127056 RepID=UPI002FDD5728